MRNCVICCVVLLAMAGTACNRDSQSLEQGKTVQEAGAGGKTEGSAKQGKTPQKVDTDGTMKEPLKELVLEAPKTLEPEKAVQESGVVGETEEPPKEISIDLGQGVKLELVLISAGSFMMGDDREKPVHKVNITKPFCLGKYEVTQEQWEAVMGSNPSKFKGATNPVETVSWDDCQAFLVKLNAKTDGQGGKFVLPTEAQWEYACRAGSTTIYCFGNDEARLGNYAWYEANTESKTHPVGEKKPNAWGLFDMHGNVFEWCQDWLGAYGAEAATDPSGPAKGSYRAPRGASWFNPAWCCRSAYRSIFEPGLRFNLVGLRVAQVPADK